MYEKNLELNDLQLLIGHWIKPNQTKDEWILLFLLD